MVARRPRECTSGTARIVVRMLSAWPGRLLTSTPFIAVAFTCRTQLRPKRRGAAAGRSDDLHSAESQRL